MYFSLCISIICTFYYVPPILCTFHYVSQLYIIFNYVSQLYVPLIMYLMYFSIIKPNFRRKAKKKVEQSLMNQTCDSKNDCIGYKL